jgi:hypothetical protein
MMCYAKRASKRCQIVPMIKHGNCVGDLSSDLILVEVLIGFWGYCISTNLLSLSAGLCLFCDQKLLPSNGRKILRKNRSCYEFGFEKDSFNFQAANYYVMKGKEEWYSMK